MRHSRNTSIIRQAARDSALGSGGCAAQHFRRGTGWTSADRTVAIETADERAKCDSQPVAVGMLVTQHPPHRSLRAALPHRALILDEWRQSELGDMDGEPRAAVVDQPAGRFLRK